VKHIIGVKPEATASGQATPVAPAAQWLAVSEDEADQRLDNYLMRQLKGVPKTHIYRIIRSGEVRVNKGRAGADTRIQAGDVVRLPPVRVSERAQDKAASMAALSAQAAPSRGFAVLHEDEAFLALDKPAGIAVHGGSGVSFGVIEQLRMARPQARFLELVHRLDRETSGILLVAKKRSALKNLQEQFRQRQTGKTYLALVLGDWPAHKKVLDKPLHKYLLESAGGTGDGERRVKVVARDDPDGMPSVTLVKVLARSAPGSAQAMSLLAVTIKTGRTHQIRVHLASEGLPIAGDDKYGNFEANKVWARDAVPLRRMFLHAWRLQIAHPTSGQAIALQTPLAAELVPFLQARLPGALATIDAFITAAMQADTL
jgi:23S rRNA pseudouridine955/2504/2580 synthase